MNGDAYPGIKDLTGSFNSAGYSVQENPQFAGNFILVSILTFFMHAYSRPRRGIISMYIDVFGCGWSLNIVFNHIWVCISMYINVYQCISIESACSFSWSLFHRRSVHFNSKYPSISDVREYCFLAVLEQGLGSGTLPRCPGEGNVEEWATSFWCQFWRFSYMHIVGLGEA